MFVISFVMLMVWSKLFDMYTGDGVHARCGTKGWSTWDEIGTTTELLPNGNIAAAISQVTIYI
jgi:hypothetical protein